MALRLSAIWNRIKKIDVPMLVLWLGLNAVNMYGAYQIEPVQGISYCISRAKQVSELLIMYDLKNDLEGGQN